MKPEQRIRNDNLYFAVAIEIHEMCDALDLLNRPGLLTERDDRVDVVVVVHAARVIHYHGVGPATLAWIPRLFKPKAKVVVTLHALDRQNADGTMALSAMTTLPTTDELEKA